MKNGSENRVERSLKDKVLRTSVRGSLILGIAALLMGLIMYSYTLFEQTVADAGSITDDCAVGIEVTVDVPYMIDQVMTIYNGLSDEERSMPLTDEYHSHFLDLFGDPVFISCGEKLFGASQNYMVNDVYLTFIDEERNALVYIYDPDVTVDTGCYPGDWEEISDKEAGKLLNWDRKSRLYNIEYTKRYGIRCIVTVPLLNADREICCFVMTDVLLKDIFAKMGVFILRFTLGILAVIALSAWRLSRKMDQEVVQPVNEITDAAQKYASERQQGIASMHFAHLNIKTGDELEKLSRTMAEMETALADYEIDLTAITAERERILTELSLAEKIQAGVLTKDFPDRNEFEIFAKMDPAREVGGDFYDFYLVDDDHLALTIADVSGKGIPASLMMMGCKIKIADYMKLGESPADVFEAANNEICAGNIEQMFVTAWLGLLELSSGKLKAVNAGHEYPIIRQPDGLFEIVKDKHGFVLGGMQGMKYHEYEIDLKPGSTLFLYTDGVPEASAADEQLFGMDRMIETLNREPDASPEQILSNVRIAVDDFVKDAEQFDDLTMMCVKYHGPK